eukprot:CAMPEP_0180439820 /NCGR_PEP_ID=MMETSP1036_2-20121128/12786_1 /TAXON_ID=632150 /ORGANISM="Azadinium spinosum, Strain 3D9" /LENGTH=87 /DNA_ID=CAMNT_0022445973 /DNA_START=278 /DNA_END=538 /DNA_ORIENTATION=+
MYEASPGKKAKPMPKDWSTQMPICKATLPMIMTDRQAGGIISAAGASTHSKKSVPTFSIAKTQSLSRLQRHNALEPGPTPKGKSLYS